MTDPKFPRITFGIIVLNGHPFTRYCLRSIYPYAHEIIVVEGGHEDTKSVTTPDGHSIDGTLEVLNRFKEDEDPENKVQIITREGHWPKKDELGRDRTPQSRAYAERATGDYLWQVDIDEFYRGDDILKIIDIINGDETITGITFPTYTFWGRKDITCDSWELRRGARYYHRLFKWGKGYQYKTHEPPTVLDEKGRDLRDLNWVNGNQMEARGIYMYHYSLLFPWQVEQKVKVYQDEKPDICSEIVKWAEENYFKITNPYRVHNLYQHPSWLEYFYKSHPEQIELMMKDINSGQLKIKLRSMDDVELLLNNKNYTVGIWIRKWGFYINEFVVFIIQTMRKYRKELKNWFKRN
jgi:hypothetical protein